MIGAPGRPGVCGAPGVGRAAGVGGAASAWVQSPGASCRKRLAASCRQEPDAAGNRSVHSASPSKSAASAACATSVACGPQPSACAPLAAAACGGATARSWAASWRKRLAVASSAASDLACSAAVQTASSVLRVGLTRDVTCTCIHALATAALAATALAAALTATALAAAALAAALAAVALAAATLTRGLDHLSVDRPPPATATAGYWCMMLKGERGARVRGGRTRRNSEG